MAGVSVSAITSHPPSVRTGGMSPIGVIGTTRPVRCIRVRLALCASASAAKSCERRESSREFACSRSDRDVAPLTTRSRTNPVMSATASNCSRAISTSRCCVRASTHACAVLAMISSIASSTCASLALTPASACLLAPATLPKSKSICDALRLAV